jgi:hypothetical protein
VGVVELVGDEIVEAPLHRPASLAVPHAGQVGDLLQ